MILRMTMTYLSQTRCHPRRSVLSVRPVHLQLCELDLQSQFVETSDGDFLALMVTEIL